MYSKRLATALLCIWVAGAPIALAGKEEDKDIVRNTAVIMSAMSDCPDLKAKPGGLEVLAKALIEAKGRLGNREFVEAVESGQKTWSDAYAEIKGVSCLMIRKQFNNLFE